MRFTSLLSGLILNIITTSNIFAAAHDLTIDNILENCPHIAEMKPSLNMLHLNKQETYQKIDDTTYEIRYVVYVTNNQEYKDKILKNLIQENNLGSEKLNRSSRFSNSLEIYSIVQPDSLQTKGVHFIISLRPLTSEEAESIR